MYEQFGKTVKTKNENALLIDDDETNDATSNVLMLNSQMEKKEDAKVCSLIVIKYYTDNCESCKAILRDWIKLSMEYENKNVLFINVNCTYVAQISGKRAIYATPTFVICNT